MATEALELKKGDSRLTEELTAPETLSIGFGSWEQWASFESDQDPTSVWQKMLSPEGSAAIPFYIDMERKDGHYSSQLKIRKAAVLSKTWRLNPTGSGEPVADFIEDALWGVKSWETFLRECLDALGKGVSIQEIIYARDGGRLVIEAIKARPQAAFTFNAPTKPPVGPLRLSQSAMSLLAAQGLQDALGPDGLLPSNKFVVTTFEMEQGNRWGSPLGRNCWWLHWFKRQDIKFWLKFIEKGTGTVLAKYPQGADDAMKQQALAAAKAITRTTAVAISEQFVVELLEKARAGGGAGEVFARLAEDLCNTEMSLLIRGQTLTARGGDRGSGSLALGEVHERVSNLVLESDAKMLMEVVQQQVVDPLTALNFGPDTEPPEFIIEYEEGEDLNTRVARDEKLARMVEIPKTYIRETYQLPEPEAGEEVVQVSGVGEEQVSGTRDQVSGQRRREFADPDPALDRGDQEPVVIEREALKQARGMYAGFISELIARAGEEFGE